MDGHSSFSLINKKSIPLTPARFIAITKGDSATVPVPELYVNDTTFGYTFMGHTLKQGMIIVGNQHADHYDARNDGITVK